MLSPPPTLRGKMFYNRKKVRRTKDASKPAVRENSVCVFRKIVGILITINKFSRRSHYFLGEIQTPEDFELVIKRSTNLQHKSFVDLSLFRAPGKGIMDWSCEVWKREKKG